MKNPETVERQFWHAKREEGLIYEQQLKWTMASARGIQFSNHEWPTIRDVSKKKEVVARKAEIVNEGKIKIHEAREQQPIFSTQKDGYQSAKFVFPGHLEKIGKRVSGRLCRVCGSTNDLSVPIWMALQPKSGVIRWRPRLDWTDEAQTRLGTKKSGQQSVMAQPRRQTLYSLTKDKKAQNGWW